MEKIKVIIDSNEHRMPLQFPEYIVLHRNRSKRGIHIAVETEVRRLIAGDYGIDGFLNVTLTETKRSADEVYNNVCGSDFSRANTAFKRLCTVARWPLLVCEFSQADLLSHREHPRLIDGLCWAVQNYGMNVWFAGPRHARGARRKTAEIVLRLMLSRIVNEW